MKRIAIFMMLVAFSLPWPIRASAQNSGLADYERQSRATSKKQQKEAKRAARKRFKQIRKAEKKQRKAMKKYTDQQAKANK
ncbi:MAG: hypothetical protein ABSH39_00625 [Candidatus Acidiferrum sp.]